MYQQVKLYDAVNGAVVLLWCDAIVLSWKCYHFAELMLLFVARR